MSIATKLEHQSSPTFSDHKQSEFGLIPNAWNIKFISQILIRGRLGGNYPNQDQETDCPLIKMGNLGRGQIDISKVEYIQPGIVPDPVHRLMNADVLFNTRNTLDLVGKVAIWRNELPAAYYNSNLMRLEFDEKDVISNCYANYALNSHRSVLLLRAIATGTTSVAAIYTRDLLRLPFIVPPHSEQYAIASALSDADRLINALNSLIAKKRAIKLAAMQQLLTGKTRLPGFTQDWKPLAMAKKSVLKARIGWQGLTTAEYLKTGEYRLVTGTDFEAGRIDWSHCFYVTEKRYRQDPHIQLKPGDVLLTKDGTIGKVGYVDELPGPATLNSGVFVIRPKNGAYDSLFLFYILKSRIFEEFLAKLQAGSTIVHLYQKDFVSFRFMAPPITEQQAIVSILSNMDSELAVLDHLREKTTAIKQGMMQVLLTGRIRLL